MARPREFEPTEALDKAMRLFWQKGYLDTSMEELVQVTGVSRYGFYTAFGDKHDLFVKAMERYARTVIPLLLAPMETTDASITEIRGYFNSLLTAAQNTPEQAGCLIGNTVMEMTPLDQTVAANVDNHFTRMRGAFLNALQNAKQRCEVSAELDAEAYADYLVGVAMGFLMCVRRQMPVMALRRFIHVALAGLG